MRLATLFSGIGAPEQAARRVYGNDLETVFACEINSFARRSFFHNYDIPKGHFHISVDDNPMNLYRHIPYTIAFAVKSKKIDKDTKKTLAFISKKRPKFKEFSNILTNDFLTRYKGKIDCIVGGSPCQDFSIAGLRAGIDGKRGQLIWQYFRIIKEIMPPIFIYENVKGFISDKRGKTLKDFLEVFRSIGYNCHYGVLDTQDYGVPQHRERIYIIGFIDIGMYFRFQFAPKQPRIKKLRDVLEMNVEEKYYLSAKMIEGFKKHNEKHKEKGTGFLFNPKGEDEVANCLRAQNGLAATDNIIKQLNPNYKSQSNTIHNLDDVDPSICAGTHGYALGYINEGVVGMLDIKGNDQNRRVYGVAPTLNTMQGGMREPKIMVISGNRQGFEEATVGDAINIKNLKSKTRRGRVGKQISNTIECNNQQVIIEPMIRQKSQSGTRYREECGTLTASANRNDLCVFEPKIIDPSPFNNYATYTDSCPTILARGSQDPFIVDYGVALRRLTPRECLRLQDFPETFKQVVSDSQMYKQVGNSKSCNVPTMIFRQIEEARNILPTFSNLLQYVG